MVRSFPLELKMVSSTYFVAADQLARLAESTADAAEVAGRLADDVVGLLRSSGIGAMALPNALGGPGLDPASLLAVLETVAAGDGSAGWVAMITSTSAVTGSYLSDKGAEEVFAKGSFTLAAGVLAPRGKARPVDGGFRVSGQWPFGSGCHHADWLTVGAMVEGADHPLFCFLPAGEVEILDTWHVTGLRGTGSNDLLVEDRFVPTEHTYRLDTPLRGSDSISRLPVYGLLAVGIAAVALGIARAALDDFTRLACGKTPTGSKRLLGERGSIQELVARSTGRLDAARGFLRAEADSLGRADVVDLSGRARLRIAANLAVSAAVEVVDGLYTAAGGTSVYNRSPLQRRFRDIHTATQHMMVAQPVWELAGKVLMGLPAETAQL
jgi:indole-3-acetate monooxygenase